MRLALGQARRALARGDVPVGAVVVRAGEVVAEAHNRREGGGSALLHAELEALQLACARLGGWRLTGCTLYVTLEPCAMCAGAAMGARADRVVYGASDALAGACGSVCDLFAMPFPYTPALRGGVLAEECAALLTEFFRSRRAQNE